ncbi:uncharacterized protein [Haliotis cracherodii]|uniref:uncharacterized protein n=1 Tax=Haliotis cracherodii TaxID=6455 RepID=UPI0039EACD60
MSNVTINKDEVQSERIIQLNKERAGIQSAFTRTKNQINGLIVNKNASQTDIEHVEGSVKSIEKIFDSLTQKVNHLKEIVQDDAEEISKLEMYMNKMSDRLKTVMSSVQMWHHDTVKPSDSASQVGSHASSGSTRSKIAARRAALKVKQSALKKSQELKLKKFELELQEETLQMETELAAAEAEIKAINEIDGPPSVKDDGIMGTNPKTVHLVSSNPIPTDRARKLLLERFGNQYVIAKAWVDKVTDVPNLKPNDSAGLRRYADSMPVLEGSAVSQCDVDKWKHFQGIDLPMVEGKFAKVTVLIGQDNPLVLTPLEVRSGKADEPYATKTIFGWAINGPLRRGIQQDMTSNFVQVEANLESQVEKFWHLDNVSDGRSQLSFHDKQVIQLWDNTVERERRHYKLPIPFKVNPPNLPNNFCMAETRLVSLTKKLSRNDDMYEHYKAGIDDMVYKGYAEKVPDDEVCIDDGSVWYLPHHVVTSDKKPGKFRIVFDCSAKFGGISLNESVHQGPDLTNILMGVLLRFREKRIAIAGDIESMYHRVKVADQHRNALRFLWWKNGELGGDIEVYRMTSHLFGGIWSSSCANYALRKTAADNADDFDKDTIQTVTDNFYVDDCLKSVDSKEKGIKLVQNVYDLLQRGGFRLTKWTSNSRTVLQSIPVEERAKELKDINLCDDELPQEKALGVKWDTETDQLGFKFQPKNRPATKRGLLSILTSVYDPIGFLSPLILKAKMIFQDECRLRKGWDTALESISHERWSNWLSKLCHIEDFTVSRCVIPNDFCEMMSAELHHFADASIAGYGPVSYVRIVDSCGRIHCSFLMAKSTLAPIKSITIPRLELCAAVLSVILDEMLRKELRMETEQSTFWTDSMIVLHYIKNDFQRYQTFVANRVTQIREGSSPQSWRYVQSSLNPAEDASRGLDADELLAKENWLQGPSFLWENKDTWQKTPTVLPVSGEDLEVKKVKVNFASSDKVEPSTTDRLLSRYSSWYHLKKMVAWILRLKHCLLRRVREGNSEERISMEPLVVSEMKQAETEIVRAIHLEKLDSMDTDSFINALRRFEARRGVPDIVRSDNGTNFRGAQKELREAIRAWNHHEIQEHMLQKEIQWMFNPPSASHMGGVWERQIRTEGFQYMTLTAGAGSMFSSLRTSSGNDGSRNTYQAYSSVKSGYNLQ